MEMYNLIEHSDNYSKTYRTLWQYYKYKLAVNNNGGIVVFNAAKVTDLFLIF